MEIVILADPEVLLVIQSIKNRAQFEILPVVLLNSFCQICHKQLKLCRTTDQRFAVIREGNRDQTIARQRASYLAKDESIF